MKLAPYTRRTSMLEISTQTFEAIEEYLKWADGVPRRFNYGMDLLIRFMAYTNQGFAQGMSAGPYDPTQRMPQWAWRTPDQGIRRISERYYVGWKVRKAGSYTWQLYNDSREAFFIEYGIHQSGRRIRRPVQKLSLRKTLLAMMKTAAYHRIWTDQWVGPHRNVHRGGFHMTTSSPGSYTGPRMGLRISTNRLRNPM